MYRRLSIILLGCFLAPALATAQSSFTWNGGGTSSDWSDTGNWGGSNGKQYGIQNFAGSARTVNTNDNGGTLGTHRVFFNSGASSFTLRGDALQLFDYSGADPKIENNSSNLQTIELNILGDNADVDPLEINPVDGSITLKGTVDMVNNELHVYGDNGHTLRFEGVVSESTGSHKLIVQQNSVVQVAAACTYPGDTEIDEGELQIDQDGSLSSGRIYVGNSSQQSDTTKLLIIDSNGDTTVNEPITVRQSSGAQYRIIGATHSSGDNTFSGAVTLESAVSLDAGNAGGTLIFSGVMSGDYDVTLTGPGTVKMTAENTFGSGQTLYIDSGTLELNRASGDPLDCNEIKLGYQAGDVTLLLNSSDGFSVDNQVNVRSTAGTKAIRNAAGTNAITANVYLDAALAVTGTAGRVTFSGTDIDLKGNTLTVQGAGDTTIRSVLKNSTGTGAITKEGSGTLTLTGANTFSGATTLSGGTTTYTGTNTSSAVTIASGATLKGTGSLGATTVNGMIAPGASAGEIRIAALTLPAGGEYRWEVGNAGGSAGANWDLITVNEGGGTVTVSASSGSKFTIALDDTGISGFVNTATYAWKIIDAGTLDAYDVTDFTIDETGWSSDKGSGSFSLSENGGDLFLNFSSVQPALAVGPSPLTSSVPLGTIPSDNTFNVTNTGNGTLFYTNTVSYGQGWGSMTVTVAAESNALGQGEFQVHTASLSRATSVGTFYATNTVSGNQTNSDQTVDIELTVTNLPNPTGLSVSDRGTRDVTVDWTQHGSYDVVVVRRQGANPDPPVNGTAYAHDATYGAGGRNQVIYAAGSGASDTDTGLDPQTVYYYGFFTENFDYYSPGAFLCTTTLTSEVDGNDEEWVGVKPTVVNSSGVSSNEFIWTDKEGEQRNDSGQGSDVDMHEFRIRADADDVYFMVKYQDITDVGYPYVAVGVDTDRSSSDTAMNWIADDSDTGLGDGYYTNGNAAMHYPETNVIVHTVPNVGQRIEMHSDGGSSWSAPATHGNTATYFEKDSNDIVEFKIARADLGLSGAVTARLTVASYFNNTLIGDNQWANDGDTTASYDGTDAQDTLSVLPYGVDDAAGNYGTAGEETDDNDLDTFFDVRFDANGLAGNQLPVAPDISDTSTTFPTNNATIEQGGMTFKWPAGSDADDDVTSYFIEVSTDSGFNGGENQAISYRANTRHTDTDYSVSPGPAAGQYYWRVRSRDLGGMLSGHTTNAFTVSGGDDDTSGPAAKLLYIGTLYTAGATQTNITDQDLANTNDYVDIAVEWTDLAGVFMTNASPHPNTNILSSMGRVIPNWDLYVTNPVTHETSSFGFDEPFTNFLGANADLVVTTVYYNAFAVTNINTNNLFYLTVSAEDEDNDRGAYPDPQGDGDPVPHDRSVTTNALVQFLVTDDDETPPELAGFAVIGNSRGNGIVLGDELVDGSWMVTGMVRDVDSGIHVNGSSTSPPTNSPYLSLIDPNGATRMTTVFDSFSFTNGQATSYEPISNASPASVSGAIPSGTWTVMVVVAENDFDRTNDTLVTTNILAFSVPTFEWDAGGGANRDWSTAANWTVDTEPAAGDTAHINGGYTAVVSVAMEAADNLLVGDDAFSGGLNGTGYVEHIAGDLTVGTDLVLGENQGDLGRYSISNGTLMVWNDVVVGDMGKGYLTVTGTADVTISFDLRVGDGGSGPEDSGSTLTVGGGTTWIGDDLLLGDSAGGADGTMTMVGGNVEVVNFMRVGDASGASGAAAISGGQLSVNTGDGSSSKALVIGASGHGTMTVTGTATVDVINTANGDVVVGGNANNGNDNTLTVSGGTMNVGDSLEIGNALGAKGTVQVSGGALSIADNVYVGNATNTTGAVQVSGGVLSIADDVYVGNATNATGTVTVTGGTVTNDDGNVVIGDEGTGSMTVAGTANVAIKGASGVGDITVGDDAGASGTLNVTGGTLAMDGELRIGVAAGATGTVSVSGGLLDVAVDGSEGLVVGDAGNASLTISGVSTVRVNEVGAGGDLLVGTASASDNTVNMNGGLLDVEDNFIIGDGLAAGGALNVTDGSVAVAGYLHVADNMNATGTVSMSGGQITVGENLAVGYGGIATMTVSAGAITAGTIRVSDMFDADGSCLTISGGRVATSGGGGFAVDYDGTLSISAGELEGDTFNLGVDGEATVDFSGGTIVAGNDFNVGAGDGGTGRVTQTGGTLDINGDNPLNIGGQGTTNRFGFYTITNGVIDINAGGDASDLLIGEMDTGGGTGVFHVVGGQPTITVGDDLELSSHTNAVLAVTIVNDQLAAIQVGDDIKLNGTLSVSNDPSLAAGTYVVATSLNASAVLGTFDSTNWPGAVEGRVFYDDNRVSLLFGAEMAVLGTDVSQVITNNDNTPAALDGTDFGAVMMPFSDDHTFTVTNLDATYTLNLTGSPVVDISGVHSDHYSVVTAPATSIAPGAATTFTVRFTPTTEGAKTGVVSIACNDDDANPYTFTIHGTGEFAPEPTIHASDLLFQDVTNVQMKVSWDNGDGSTRIVVAKQSSAVTGGPIDGSNYTANTAFGSGNTIAAGEFVVYDGGGTSVVVTSLSPGTTYHFEVFEYNGISYGVNYYTNGTPLSGSQATATYPPVITEGAQTTVTMSENGNPTAFSLTLNATDPDPGDTLTWSIRNVPEHGTASVSGTGLSKAINYSPNDLYSGTDSFTVQVTDAFGNYDTITVNVTITTVSVPGKPVFIFE